MQHMRRSQHKSKQIAQRKKKKNKHLSLYEENKAEAVQGTEGLEVEEDTE